MYNPPSFIMVIEQDSTGNSRKLSVSLTILVIHARIIEQDVLN
jgi:hypothetical protein